MTEPDTSSNSRSICAFQLLPGNCLKSLVESKLGPFVLSLTERCCLKLEAIQTDNPKANATIQKMSRQAEAAGSVLCSAARSV